MAAKLPPLDIASAPSDGGGAGLASPVDPDGAGGVEAVPSPRTAVANAAKLRLLEERMKHLEAKLEELSPTKASPAVARHLTDTFSDTLSPADLRGSSSPIPDDGSVAGSIEGDTDGAGAGGPPAPDMGTLDADLSDGGGGGDGTRLPVPPLPASDLEASPKQLAQSVSAFTLARPSTADHKVLTSEELFIVKVTANLSKLVAGRKPVVLVSTGAYNPIHLQHVRMFYLARKVPSALV